MDVKNCCRKDELGLVHVYTGNGKGKTTAALGLAFRAVGCGLKAIMIQFLKPSEEYGEQLAAKRFEGFEIVSMGLDHMCSDVTRSEDVRLAHEALDRLSEILSSGKYDLVIADEINVAMSWELLGPEEVIDVLDRRAPFTEVVLTGRGAPEKIEDYADLVTDMLLVKHPFDRGIPARRGVEF
ncbi:MAG: cob(I)yrinic acid a,c-diamide adenosyltransferase [Candidatus Methanomethylophilaceae archaeon]|nr:cob(I)alamin adenosyltransferase [Candidatus Methanomethylophilaceae archaeon]